AEIVRAGARAGWPVAVHAIGDLANRDALDAFEETRAEWAPLGLRPRIEHAQLLSEQDIPRFGELGVAASVQFSHAPSDRDIAERTWAGRTDRAYAYRSLLDSGAVVANGSDAPTEELAPLAGIRAGVPRTLDEREAWHPAQAVTVDEALLCRRDAEPDVVDWEALVRRVDVALGEIEAREDRRDLLALERGHHRKRAADADQQRPGADHPLEGVLAELDRRIVGLDQSSRSAGDQLDLDVGAVGSRFAHQSLHLGCDHVLVLTGHEPD